MKKRKHFELVVVELSSSSHLNSHVPVPVAPVNTVSISRDIRCARAYPASSNLACSCLLLAPPFSASTKTLSSYPWNEYLGSGSIFFTLASLFCFIHHLTSTVARPRRIIDTLRRRAPNVSRQIRHRSFATVNSYRNNFLTGNLAACEA